MALCDVDAGRAVRAARLVPGARVERDVHAIAGDASIDAVAVCTPPATHAVHGTRILEAGKHLFVEKPLAVTREDSDALVARAAKTERVAVVGFNLRHHRLLRDARNLIARGALGRIDLVRSVFTTDTDLTSEAPWRSEPGAGGDVLLDLATHHFDVWRWLLGVDVVEVTAMSHDAGSFDASASVTAKLSSGATATVHVAARAAPLNQLDIFGERARIRVSLYDFAGLEVAPLTRAPGSLTSRARAIVRKLVNLPAGVRALRGGEYTQAYVREWRHFADCVLRGAPAAATLDDGRAAVRIALAAAESITLGRPVLL